MTKHRTAAEDATPKKPRSGLNDGERATVKAAVIKAVLDLASQLSKAPEAVATQAFYVLQWGRNATRADKDRSFAHWKKCYFCPKPLTRAEATFHHLERGIPDQHGPANLVPMHERCHDTEHAAVKGSLRKGSR